MTEAVDRVDVATTLREHVARQLPEYMVPSAYVRLAALPLTPNGKLDRKALPAPDGERSCSAGTKRRRARWSRRSRGCGASCWGSSGWGGRINFFELGGHSLLAVRLMERLRGLGLSTDVRTLFTTPTLAALAVTLGSHRDVVVPANVIAADATAITPDQLPLIELGQADIDRIVAQVPGGVANVQDIYALSPLQEGILFHHLLAGEGDPYLLIGQMAFPSRAMLDRYLAAVQAVVDRHDILRTGFVWEGLPTAAQVVWRNARLQVTEVEVEDNGIAASEQLARRFDPRRHRMDVTRAPLLQFVIGKEPGSERWVVTELHAPPDRRSLDAGDLARGGRRGAAGPAGRASAAAAVPDPGGAGPAGGERGGARAVLPRAPGGHRRADDAVRAERGASRRSRRGGSAGDVAGGAERTLAWPCAAAGRELGEPVPSRVGAGGGADEWARAGGVRDGAVRADARRKRRPGDGAVHQHAAGAAESGRDGGGSERAADARGAGGALASRACVAGAGAAVQRGGGPAAAVQCAAQLSA